MGFPNDTVFFQSCKEFYLHSGKKGAELCVSPSSDLPGKEANQSIRGVVVILGLVCLGRGHHLPVWQPWAPGVLDGAHHHVLGVTVTTGSYSNGSRVAPRCAQRCRALQ